MRILESRLAQRLAELTCIICLARRIAWTDSIRTVARPASDLDLTGHYPLPSLTLWTRSVGIFFIIAPVVMLPAIIDLVVTTVPLFMAIFCRTAEPEFIYIPPFNWTGVGHTVLWLLGVALRLSAVKIIPRLTR